MTDPAGFKPFVLPDDVGPKARGAGALEPVALEPVPANPDEIPEPLAPALELVPLPQFLAEDEQAPEPLAGEPDDALLPQEGVLLMYGDGGAGKTTLTLDAIAHLASGQEWLTVPVPRPLRILIIENEGPRTEFRRSLQVKADAWQGPRFTGNVAVMREPWGNLDLRLVPQRTALAHGIGDLNIDLVCLGPLASLGVQGGGTPDEINDFHRLLTHVRDLASRPFALWMIHHENKSGDVSGAWERYPDTLVHVQGQGNGRTRVYWRKVRWSSRLHGTSVNLQWADGRTYEPEEQPNRDLHAEALAWLADQDGYRNYGEIVDALQVRRAKIRPVLDELTEAGHLQHAVGVAAGDDQEGHRRHPSSL